MEIIEEEFWKKIPLPSMFIITTNGMVGDQNELVMGTGVALQAAKRIKGIAKICGKLIKEKGTPFSDNEYNCKYLYYFLPVLENEGKNYLGIFQVKLDWRNIADLKIMEQSCKKLLEYMELHPNYVYRMNYPGIGAGRLTIGTVEPLLKKYFSNKNITFCVRSEI